MSYVYSVTGTPVQPSQVYYREIALSANTTLSWPFANNDSDDVAAQLMQVTPAAANLALTMPPADEAPNGYATIIYNEGADDFDVEDNDGGVLATLASGDAKYFAITDNTDAAGTWRVIGFGTGTTTANASDLAGGGLKAISSTLNENHQITDLNANYTVNTGDRGSLFNWTGGAGTLSFAAAATLTNGFVVFLRNSGSGTLTLNPNGAELINGQSTFDLDPTDSAIVITDGNGFFTIGYGVQNTFIFSLVSLDVSGSNDVTVTTSQASNKIVQLTGTISGNINVDFPATPDVYWVQNNTSGAYTVTVRPVSGSGVSVAQGASRTVVSNGTDMYYGDAAGGGTVVSIGTGAGLTGGPISVSGTIALATTGVVSGTYNIPTIIVNQYGQLTSAASGTVSLTTQVTGTLPVSNGGTGLATVTANKLVKGNGTSALTITSINVGSSDEIDGYKGSINTQTGTTYTLQASDTGKIVEYSSASAVTVTLPNSLAQGWEALQSQVGAGQVTFSAAAGASLINYNSHTKTAGQYAQCLLYVRENSGGSAAVYVLSGQTGA